MFQTHGQILTDQVWCFILKWVTREKKQKMFSTVINIGKWEKLCSSPWIQNISNNNSNNKYEYIKPKLIWRNFKNSYIDNNCNFGHTSKNVVPDTWNQNDVQSYNNTLFSIF